MVARQAIPFSRTTGKLLFPRRLVEGWLEAQTELPAAGNAPPPAIAAGANDPLLEWPLRQAGTGLAVLAFTRRVAHPGGHDTRDLGLVRWTG